MAENQRQWYVVYSKPHKEEQAQFHLRARDIEVFFPRLNVNRGAETRRRIIPLFPNYLFVRVELETEAHRVMWSPGVKRIVSFGDQPAPLDSLVVDLLQSLTDSDGAIKARSTLRTGQQVEICGGPFDGLLGIIQDPPDARGRVRILLQLLSRQISVRMDVEFIQGEWLAIGSAVSHQIGQTSASAVG
ncbi:MAG: transcription termination/antitermination protein NusG [Alphaproteobacteria bacterium]